eukprot:760223-Hanusia_phi.AAC.2
MAGSEEERSWTRGAIAPSWKRWMSLSGSTVTFLRVMSADSMSSVAVPRRMFTSAGRAPSLTILTFEEVRRRGNGRGEERRGGLRGVEVEEREEGKDGEGGGEEEGEEGVEIQVADLVRGGDGEIAQDAEGLFLDALVGGAEQGDDRRKGPFLRDLDLVDLVDREVAESHSSMLLREEVRGGEGRGGGEERGREGRERGEEDEEEEEKGKDEEDLEALIRRSQHGDERRKHSCLYDCLLQLGVQREVADDNGSLLLDLLLGGGEAGDYRRETAVLDHLQLVLGVDGEVAQRDRRMLLDRLGEASEKRHNPSDSSCPHDLHLVLGADGDVADRSHGLLLQLLDEGGVEELEERRYTLLLHDHSPDVRVDGQVVQRPCRLLLQLLLLVAEELD